MMKKRMLALSLLILVGLISVPSSLAYFTTNAHADGSYGIELGNDTDIDETVEDLTKHIVVDNHEESQPVFIRVKLFYGNEAVSNVSIDGTDWSLGEGDFWYYANPVDPGSSTSELTASIQIKNADDKIDFNVIVVSESTPVIYDENNNPSADWSQVLDNE